MLFSFALYPLLSLVLLFQSLPPFGGPITEGRKGNRLFEEKQYADARQAYKRGLTLTDGEDHALRSRLLNNMGATYYREETYKEAFQQFEHAFHEATLNPDRNRAAYNAGNAAYRLRQLEKALQFYREALLANPSDENARFNYEFVKRKLKQQQQNQSSKGESPPDNQRQKNNQGNSQRSQRPEDSSSPDQSSPDGSNQKASQAPQPPSSDEQGDASSKASPKPEPGSISPQQAERILQALQQDEKKLLRQLQRQKVKPRKTKKDW